MTCSTLYCLCDTLVDPWNVRLYLCICTMGSDCHLLNTSAFDNIFLNF